MFYRVFLDIWRLGWRLKKAFGELDFDEEVLAVLMATMVVAAVFAVFQTLYAGRVIELFSELGLLGRLGR